MVLDDCSTFNCIQWRKIEDESCSVCWFGCFGGILEFASFLDGEISVVHKLYQQGFDVGEREWESEDAKTMKTPARNPAHN